MEKELQKRIDKYLHKSRQLDKKQRKLQVKIKKLHGEYDLLIKEGTELNELLVGEPVDLSKEVESIFGLEMTAKEA